MMVALNWTDQRRGQCRTLSPWRGRSRSEIYDARSTPTTIGRELKLSIATWHCQVRLDNFRTSHHIAQMKSRKTGNRRHDPAALSERVSLEFGVLLQQCRRERKVSQETFASEMGLSRTTISNIECGRQRVFLDQLYHAAELLKVDLSELLPPFDPTVPRRRVRTATDDPLSKKATQIVERVVESVTSDLNRSNQTARR